MTERLSSGQPRLDGILQGGLPANAINLIIGPPGSGKTILVEQYVFRNATVERPALYLSTVSEPFDKGHPLWPVTRILRCEGNREKRAL